MILPGDRFTCSQTCAW